ncbi:MAG: hypothetical protein PQJ60_05890 [Spirochaetales bacterium]|nr:hypothetical protein [Spirochaetales bacterium]
MKKTKKIKLTVSDAEHLEAHRGDFYAPLEEVYHWITEDLSSRPFQAGELHTWIKREAPVGLTGVKHLKGKDEEDFWGYRQNRHILSHLFIGEKEETCDLCYLGFWDDPEHFRLHTCYPGRTAPREIHDAALTPREMKEAVAFWSVHALIVEEGEYSL